MARILAVQEKEKNIADIKKSLRGHEILIATSLMEAMQILSADSFDMIICAVHLRDGSVYDLLKYSKQELRHRNTAFVFFCNEPSEIAQFVSDSTEATAKLLGADKFITTFDFSATQFRAEIDSLLNQPQTISKHQLFIAEEQERARAAMANGRSSEAEKILKILLQQMQANTDLYEPIDLATVQHELSLVLEAEGKSDEAEQSRQLLQDF